MKSKHEFVNKIIPYSELKNFIEPITVTIPIPVADLEYIGGRKKEEFHAKYKKILCSILKSMPNITNKIGDRKIEEIALLSYTPHENGYDFRINPIDMINSIMLLLGVREKIPFFNLDDEKSRLVFKEYTKRTVDRLKETNINLSAEFDELSSNIDYIDSLYSLSIEADIRKNNFILAKDALLYLAYSSLISYSATQKKEYIRIPYEYYHYIGHMNTSAFPHKIRVGNSAFVWFDNFMKYYETSVGKHYIPVFNEFSLENKECLCGWEILKSGGREETFEEASKIVSRLNTGKNDERNMKLFMMKTNFYQSSPYKVMIKGRFGLNGYIGFVYDNDYIVYDKLYNNEDVPNEKKTILSHPEAIYSIPSDRLIITTYNKQQIKDIKEQDPRIVKTNHTISGTFLRRIDDIIKGPNLSTKTFDEAVVEEKDKVLILR